MKILNVTDEQFKQYGKILENYDFSEMFKAMEKIEIPEDGINYVPSYSDVEKCNEFIKLKNRGFGGIPIQIGYVSGKCRTLNCLEYHKSSEFNIPLNDVILILGKEEQIKSGKFDTSLCKAFFIPGGTGVELYGTTLHYAPFNTDDAGYRMLCVLPLGTNAPKIDITPQCDEDYFNFGVNKWLLVHKESQEAIDGATVGLEGINITYEMLEK